MINLLKWWEKKLVYSLGFLLVSHLLQIPHMVWNADVYMELGLISRINPVLDFFLYGIDLLEIPAIVAVTLSFIARFKYHNAK